MSGDVSGLHIEVLFDLADLIPLLQAHGKEHRNTSPLITSPLKLASQLDRVDVAKALLDGGADVHGIPGFPWRPILQAARRNQSTNMIYLLLVTLATTPSN